MKFRSLAFILAASAVATANAADVRFFLAYGDAAFAALNNAQVGDEMPTGVCVNVLPGTNFTVSLMLKSTAAGAVNYSGGCAFLGFDQAVTNNSTTGYGTGAVGEAAAWTAGGNPDGIKSPLRLSTTFSNYGTAAGLDGTGGATTVAFGPQGNAAFRGAARAGTAASLRSIGLNQALQFGTGNKIVLGGGQTVRVADMLVLNSLAGGDCYGDVAAENGLTLNSYSPASSGANFMGTTPAGNPNADVKYAFQAVPEPGTFLAIGAGLAALARRRRSK